MPHIERREQLLVQVAILDRTGLLPHAYHHTFIHVHIKST